MKSLYKNIIKNLGVILFITFSISVINLNIFSFFITSLKNDFNSIFIILCINSILSSIILVFIVESLLLNEGDVNSNLSPIVGILEFTEFSNKINEIIDDKQNNIENKNLIILCIKITNLKEIIDTYENLILETTINEVSHILLNNKRNNDFISIDNEYIFICCYTNIIPGSSTAICKRLITLLTKNGFRVNINKAMLTSIIIELKVKIISFESKKLDNEFNIENKIEELKEILNEVSINDYKIVSE